MSNYQLTLITNTETALNYDVICDEQYLGRLYVFPTNDTEMNALGIKKEWFLAHELGDFVVSGHVNAVGEWCVSPHLSLEPSLEFTSQSEVFDRVFSPDYEREVLAVREMLSKEILAQETLAQEILSKEMLSQEKVSSISYLDSVSEVSDTVSGDENEDEDSSNSIAEPIVVAINDKLSIPNLEVLRELLRRSSKEELEETTEDFLRQSDKLQLVTQVNGETTENFAQQFDELQLHIQVHIDKTKIFVQQPDKLQLDTQINEKTIDNFLQQFDKLQLNTQVNGETIDDFVQQSDELQLDIQVNGEQINLPLLSDVVQTEKNVQVHKEVDQTLGKLEIIEVQDTLIDILIEEYQQRDTTEFTIPPLGLVTVHVEEEYFVLCSARDGHTVIAATFEREVLEELDESDAVEFEEVIKSSQIELSRFESLPSEVLGDSAQGSEMDAKGDDVANRTEMEKKTKGIEYGC